MTVATGVYALPSVEPGGDTLTTVRSGSDQWMLLVAVLAVIAAVIWMAI